MGYKTLEARREYYRKNKNKINAKRRDYRKNNKDKINKSQSKWRENNRELANRLSRESKKRYEKKAKKAVFENYGKKCSCCGESNLLFLSIDHINGGGTKHRKRIREKITTWLYRNNFPKGYQTLCFNCNWGKHINNGICPHKEIQTLKK